MTEGVGDFNPEKKEHKQLAEKVEETIQELEEASTPDIFEEIQYTEIKVWKKDYFRYKLLPHTLKYLIKEDRIELSGKRRNGGMPTDVYSPA